MAWHPNQAGGGVHLPGSSREVRLGLGTVAAGIWISLDIRAGPSCTMSVRRADDGPPALREGGAGAGEPDKVVRYPICSSASNRENGSIRLKAWFAHHPTIRSVSPPDFGLIG